MRTYRTSQPLIEGALCSRTWDRNQQDAMRGDFTTETRRSRLRNALIVSQVTICVLLLMCAGVLLRTGRQIQTRDLGIDTSHALVVQVQPKFRTQVIERLAFEPEVETIGAAWRVPFLDGFCTIGVTPSGQSAVSR